MTRFFDNYENNFMEPEIYKVYKVSFNDKNEGVSAHIIFFASKQNEIKFEDLLTRADITCDAIRRILLSKDKTHFFLECEGLKINKNYALLGPAGANSNKPPNDENLEIKKIIFNRPDLKRLLPNNWINDKIVDAYALTLIDDSKNKENFVTLSCSITSNIMNIRTMDAARIERMKLKNAEVLKIKKQKSEIKQIHLFINHNQNHWLLLVIALNQKKSFYAVFDSMQVSDDELKKYKQDVDFFLRNICELEIETSVIYAAKSSKQKDLSSCGLFMLLNYQHIISNIDINLEDQNQDFTQMFKSGEILNLRYKIMESLRVNSANASKN